MPVENIRANIIDLSRDDPEPRDEFVVDTNSWKELTYSRILQPKAEYQAYIKKALLQKATLYSCGITLVELASVIERNEWEIYKRTKINIERKAFRHDCRDERAAVVEEIASSWAQVRQVAQLINLDLDLAATTRILATLRASRIDGYDTLLVEAMTRRGVFNIITDDGDFATIPDITVFTANAHLISVARREGRLRRRG